MSSFALGLTKTAVEGTLSLVKSTVEEEKKLREKVQNDLVFISGEFETMQSFLRAANNYNKNDQVALTCEAAPQPGLRRRGLRRVRRPP